MKPEEQLLELAQTTGQQAKRKRKQVMIKKLLLLFVAMTALITGVTGCHTAHGAGEDIERAGEKIQDHTP
jgi:predicted small secreted protein